MRDRDVRRAVLSALMNEHADDADTRIVQEMGVWSGSVRIDIAVINGRLSGYELKSDRDNLERLPLQSDLYGKVFDRLELVVGEKHVEKARDFVPEWWGVTVAIDAGHNIELWVDRVGSDNPNLDPYLIAQLLWKDEAIEVLEKIGLARGMKSKRIREIHERLAAELALGQLAAHVRAMLKRRQGWLQGS